MVSKTYYNQYSFTLSYTVSGGGSGYSAPTLTATRYGASYTPKLTGTATAYWLDSGSSWSVTNPLGGSGTSERWQTSQTTSGTVSSSSPTTAGGSLTFTYYNQYLMTLSYSVTGGSGYSAPTFSANAFGASAPQTLKTTATGYWFDAGASWTVTNPLAGGFTNSTISYRWYTTQSTSGTVSAQTIAFVYNYQVFGIDTNCEGFGSVASGTIITTSSMKAQANELIIVEITANYNTGSSVNIADNFSSHLIYHLRTSLGISGEKIWEYYAVTDSAHTGSFTLTITMTYAHAYVVQAFGIIGANTANPFDTNTGLPYTNSNTGSSAPKVTGVSTSNANDMILGLEGQSSSTAQAAGTGFAAPSALLHNANNEGNNAEYEIVTSTQSGASVTFNNSVSTWIMIVDAVQRAW
jgi:hypothetical protein